VEVVHAEQLEVDEPPALLLGAGGLVGAGIQAQERNEKGAAKAAAPGSR
jgi:hypothetical protein